MQKVLIPRLETFYYKTVCQDLQILTYNHLEAKQLPFPISRASIYNIFSNPMTQLATQPEKNTTTYIHSLPQPLVKKPWKRPIRSILYGKTKDTFQIMNQPNDLKSKSVQSHLGIPSLSKIKLKIYSEAAISSK